MAIVPTSGTNIRFLSGIPFNSDYKNSRWFTSETEQINYFTSKPIVHREAEMNFQRIEGKHFVAINKSIDDLWNANYLMFQNSKYSNKWFYAFITKLEYKNRGTTHVHFQIDVLQTWRFKMNFKPSFVVREHRPLWNSDGTPVINTIDEGLDYGKDYETVDIQHFNPTTNFLYLVIVMKEQRHGNVGEESANDIVPTANGIPQPLTYYVHPFRLAGGQPTIKVGGTSPQGSTNIYDVLKGISKSEDAVNNVVTAYITEYIGMDIPYDSNSGSFTFPSANFSMAEFGAESGFVNFSTVHVKSLPTYASLEKNMGSKYANYHNVVESKLLMHPYTVLILDDFKGNRVEFKNEYISGKDIVLNLKGSMGTSNKVSYGIKDYLTKSGNTNDVDRDRLVLEKSAVNSDPSDIPVINDFLSAYLQGNRNSINTQRDQAIFNATMSVAGSTVSGVGSAMGGSPIGVASAGVGIVQGAGNGVLQIQAIESKIKDIDNTPPQLTRMGSNTAFSYGNGYSGVYLIKKQIHKEYRDLLTHFFKLFGYKTNQVKVPNFRTRQNWNYVQTMNCVITGDFNNEDLQDLKEVFDNGITLWHTDDVGNYDLSNGVR